MILKETVVEAIRSSFPTEPTPPEETISGGSLDPDVRAFAVTLRSKPWDNVTLADLRSDVLGITRLSDDGWYYYLPSYLFYSVNEYFRMDFVVDILLESLISPDYGDLTEDEWILLEKSNEKSELRDELKEITLKAKNDANDLKLQRIAEERYRQRIARLTARQLEAILLFLGWLRQEHGEDAPKSLISKAEISIQEAFGSDTQGRDII